ncbi:cache domain-containing sensor histidine kinase [Paenibacillus gallinarum]|uniref:Sensor histidine kinase n=1 Tax=Paenibacillus gallinarum TaxID=2762232 RepID=A0ABR8STH7_9BACL|nr:sensor histidine kinase [Paenibacillus gallinarum]MBD7966776.1 sensor histidine kinase [Paenibacillus gallinarum]
MRSKKKAMPSWKQLRFSQMPLRYQLSILFLLIGIVPALGLGVLVNFTVDRIVERQVEDNTLQLIGKVNQSLDKSIDNLQSITYLAEFDEDVQTFIKESGNERDPRQLTENMSTFFQGFTTLYPEIAGIMVVNSQGAYLSNEMYAYNDADLTEEEWFKQAAGQKGIFTVIGHPGKRSVTTHVNYTPEEVVSVARAFVDSETQDIKGVILIDLKLRSLSGIARDITLGKNGYLMILDEEGEKIYAPENSVLRHFNPSWFDDNSSGTFNKQIGNENYQFQYQTSSYTGWRTIGVFDTGDAALAVREIHFYVVCYLFIVCMFGLTAAYVLSQSISRPIHHLMSLMQKAEKGDMTLRYLGNRGDEVGQLGISFNRMLQEIKKLMAINRQKEKQKQEAELRSLTAHIKPHFLYNTLDTIHWMARKQGADDVSVMIQSLSKLFRIGLSKGSNMIPLSQEIEHISSYLQIQKTRYRDRVECHIDIKEDELHCYVVKLMLQPLVENAIYHGIKARRGAGTILIKVRKQGEALIITVSDNGAGMDEDWLQHLRKQLEDPLATLETHNEEQLPGRSYGLLNIQARIQLTFGPPYGIALDSTQGEGTKVTIIHPLLTKPQVMLDHAMEEEER